MLLHLFQRFPDPLDDRRGAPPEAFLELGAVEDVILLDNNVADVRFDLKVPPDGRFSKVTVLLQR
jgi:hypothetical protein